LRRTLQIVSPISGLLFSVFCLLVIYVLILMIGHQWMEPSPTELIKRVRSLLSGAKITLKQKNP
jgi:hypothetical protein